MKQFELHANITFCSKLRKIDFLAISLVYGDEALKKKKQLFITGFNIKRFKNGQESLEDKVCFLPDSDSVRVTLSHL